jgi:hypothetical protein
LFSQEADALTVKASIEKREAKWLNFSQKPGIGQGGRQETNCRTRTDRAVLGVSEKGEKDSAVVAWWWSRDLG